MSVFVSPNALPQVHSRPSSAQDRRTATTNQQLTALLRLRLQIISKQEILRKRCLIQEIEDLKLEIKENRALSKSRPSSSNICLNCLDLKVAKENSSAGAKGHWEMIYKQVIHDFFVVE